MSRIVLYMDWLCQPSRFCATVLKMLGVDHEIKEVRIGENEQRTPEYAQINPFLQVPAIKDGEFYLAESHTIAKYLIRSRNIETELYPLSDFQQCALIDQQLDWHHNNTRKCSQLLFNTHKFNNKNIEQAQQEVESVLKFIDQYLLKKQVKPMPGEIQSLSDLSIFQNQNKYMVGHSLTLGDISTFCELFQLLIIQYDFSKYTNIVSWQERIWQIPEIVESHEAVSKVVKKQNQQAKL